jgi:hypothetical protein
MMASPALRRKREAVEAFPWAIAGESCRLIALMQDGRVIGIRVHAVPAVLSMRYTGAGHVSQRTGADAIIARANHELSADGRAK